MILMIEMGVFGLLVIPLPFSAKRKLFTYVFSALPTTRPDNPRSSSSRGRTRPWQESWVKWGHADAEQVHL